MNKTKLSAFFIILYIESNCALCAKKFKIDCQTTVQLNSAESYYQTSVPTSIRRQLVPVNHSFPLKIGIYSISPWTLKQTQLSLFFH